MAGSRSGPGSASWRVELFWTAHKGIATHVETQEPVRLAGEANTPVDFSSLGGMVVTREPLGSHPAEVDAVQATIYLKRFCKTTRPTREVAQVLTLRLRCIAAMPSSGSSALIRTPAPKPTASLETLTIQEVPEAR